MPVIKSAQKKLRKDKKRTKENKKLKNNFKYAFKKTLENPTQKTIIQAVSLADKMAKKKIIHKNKAARIKSKLSKLIKPLKQRVKPTKNSSQKNKKS